jgi:hypothetical protein
MGCKRRIRKPVCGKRSRISDDDKEVSSDKTIFTDLQEKGRLQFFFHSPSSELPVRDVLNEQGQGHKTEPHIEIGAENFINCCYQSNNIVPFLKGTEKYLFLFTTCKSKTLRENYGRRFYGKRFIVGYIAKQTQLHFSKAGSCANCKVVARCDGRHVAKGEARIFRLEDAYPLELLISKTSKRKNTRIRKISISETKEILAYFKKPDILTECIREIERLDEKNRKENKTCKVLRGKVCRFQKNGCLRLDIP